MVDVVVFAEVPADVDLHRGVDGQVVAGRYLNVSRPGEAPGPILQDAGYCWKRGFVTIEACHCCRPRIEFDANTGIIVAGRPNYQELLARLRVLRPCRGGAGVVTVQNKIHIYFIRAVGASSELSNRVGTEVPARVLRHRTPRVPPSFLWEAEHSAGRRDQQLDSQIPDGYGRPHCIDPGERHSLEIRRDTFTTEDGCKERPKTHPADYIGLPYLKEYCGVPDP